MSKALSLDLRTRVLSAVHAGATHREAAERFGVSAASSAAGARGSASKATHVPRRSARECQGSCGRGRVFIRS